MASIQYSPFTAIFNNKAPGTIIIGRPGSGKTYFILNIAATALMYSQRVFCLDFKDDMTKLKNLMPFIEIIDINKIKPGALNPFRAIKNVDAMTLSTLIETICGGFSTDTELAITPILQDFVTRAVKTGAYINMSMLVDYLYKNTNADVRLIGQKLKSMKDSKYGGLLFNDDEKNEEILHLSNKSKVISLFGMDLPKSTDVKLTSEQKFNSGVVYIITRMLRDVLSDAEKYPSLIAFDEVHIAFQNEKFTSLIKEFLTLGRSLNIASILSTQNSTHFPASISSQISSKFCFGNSPSEVEDFLKKFTAEDYKGIMDKNEIISRVSDFELGECFYMDWKNRTGIFKVTTMFNSGKINSNPFEEAK